MPGNPGQPEVHQRTGPPSPVDPRAAKLPTPTRVVKANLTAKETPVPKMFRQRLTYANVMSTLAVFIALGGSSYAALTISGTSIKKRSIPAKKLKRNSITGAEIREARLDRVPRAAQADSLGGFTADQLRVRCPLDTYPTADVCIERTPRSEAAYGSAVLTCRGIGTPAGPGRRLPTHGELMAALAGVTLAPGGELTSEVLPSSSNPGEVNVLYVTDQVGRVAITTDTGDGSKPYRCVADPFD
jgi:hypothetical protein